ncbi:T9SS type A sorting domain-containing protein [Siphonobacter sp. SORGH_AS_0500]|uniref:T9SS type A sorting domain-containing protein n=1 Tax=Siphonobacter sp. SORGH_AS_0500 TaxID=1864824 RepID=UPI0028604427|nr:T9SS type A sorting domain-containing protein [Siphonobacter sp. SORGH_AS_0500]MDR6193831.1 hypothetical protein [Siphonobacter sp. SORGH_AS_0500]
MNRLFTCLFLLLTHSFLNAQITFTKAPLDYQLFPRNDQSEGQILIEGTVTDAAATRVSVLILRGQQPYRYSSQNLTFQNGQAAFSLKPSIKAEAVEYLARIYLVKNRDSSLVMTRMNLVAGDVFLIGGQSNAVAGGEGGSYQSYNPQLNEFCRTFTTNYPGEGPKWAVANGNNINVGVWGTEIQRLIHQNHQMPTCILNNGNGGMPIRYFSDRNDDNPTDDNTAYGQSLNRSIQAGVRDFVKAIFWRQGEFEVGGTSSEITSYPQYFDRLYKGWHLDYPNLKKVYVTQTGIQPVMTSSLAPALRDFQRRTSRIYPDVQTITAIGLKESDGIHYGSGGHVQFAHNLYPLVDRDFYNSTDTLQIQSPDPRRIYYSNPERTQVTLEFDVDQQMVFQNQVNVISKLNGWVVTYHMREFMYFDGVNNQLDSGWVEGYKVHLKLKQPSSAQKLTYLPDYFPVGHTDVYPGPYMLNQRNLYAFSFYEVPIESYRPSQTLQLVQVGLYQTQLKWNTLANTRQLVLERQGDQEAFKTIATLASGVSNYTDDSALPGQRYIYRLRTSLTTGEEIECRLLVIMPLPTMTKSLQSWEVIVSPNPVQQEALLKFNRAMVSEVTIYDLNGRQCWHQTSSESQVRLSLGNLPDGVYVLRVQSSAGMHTQRLLVHH